MVPLRELLKTNDPVLISLVQAVLTGEDIPLFVADQHMSALEGGQGILPRRILVADEDLFRARVLVAAAGVPHDELSRPPRASQDGLDV